MKQDSKAEYVLILCHGYETPFLSVANQYAALFKNSKYRVVTAFLKGTANEDVAHRSGADETVFLEAEPAQLRGLKKSLIKKIDALHQQYQFKFAIAHRYKAIYVASQISGLFVVGVAHIDGVFRPWRRRLYASYKRKNLALLGVSRAIRDDIRSYLPNFKDSRIQYLYNSLDFSKIRTQQLEKSAAREALGLSEDEFIFINLGRLHEDKDQATLLRAFAIAKEEMPHSRLVIAGKGRLENELKSLAKNLDIEQSVDFLGMVPDAFRFLKGFDCFVLSSIREGLPVSLLEAFSADLICITSRCNGSSEAIEDAGFSFNVGDHITLANLMTKVYALDEAGKAEIQKKMQNKINKNFTEAAVRTAFWNLPFIKSFN